ncbi:hypothetical protein Tsubulata_034768 [Turnera subulata]|uniref:Uncharacterized protein n=1 Tax=Turnera subulata TaxID=218843 RepID=A0A9Q0F8J2_9ROSI|nr:hypothetical protein Tsubulata_034768 [Turnera subulata]
MMKLSLTIPDQANLQDPNQNQNPLLKAKLPISIFNHPFTSAFKTATNSFSDLSFALSTALNSGPSLKLTYTPTTSSPFSLSLKSGLGLFGSPHNSPLVFSASFSLSPSSPNVILPAFSLHFKPQLGHFSLHKKTSPSRGTPDSEANPEGQPSIGPHLDPVEPSSSDFVNGFAPDGSLVWQEVKLEPYGGGGSKEKNPSGVFADASAIGLLGGRELGWRDGKKGGVLSGFGVKARTVFPLTKSVVVNLRWGVNMPGDFGVKMPYLTVNKIEVERVVEEVKEAKGKLIQVKNEGDLELLKGMCFWMKRDLEVLEKENKVMKQSLDNMRFGVSATNFSGDVGKKAPPASVDGVGGFEQWRSKKKDGEGNGRREPKKPVNQVTDLESELQKAIKAASS